MNNLLRVDGRPSGSNSYWLSCAPVQLKPVRIGDHRRSGEVGLLRRQLRVGRQRRSTAAGTTCRRSNRVNEFGAGVPSRDGRVRREERQRLRASSHAAASASRRPSSTRSSNPLGAAALRALRPQHHRHRHARLHLRQPPRLDGVTTGWRSVRDNFTWTRNTHTFKIGGHFEHAEQRGARRHVAGRHHVQQQHEQSAQHELRASPTPRSASSQQIPRPTAYRVTQNRQWW